jgi:hypothetical protein
MTSDEFLKSQQVESLLYLTFCDYEDQPQNPRLGILSPTCPAVAGLECSTNVVFFHSEKLFSPGP